MTDIHASRATPVNQPVAFLRQLTYAQHVFMVGCPGLLPSTILLAILTMLFTRVF